MTKLLAALRAHRLAWNLIAAAVCFSLFGFALYLQDHLRLNPCPLCIFQRVAVAVLGVAFVLAALVPARARVLGFGAAVLVGLAAAGGAGIAARHVYIQSLPPDQVPACGASLEFMREVFSTVEVLRKVLTGSGECAKVDWTFLGLAMPGWMLIAMLVLGAAGVLLNWRGGR